jgi:hypothetical protein
MAARLNVKCTDRAVVDEAAESSGSTWAWKRLHVSYCTAAVASDKQRDVFGFILF